MPSVALWTSSFTRSLWTLSCVLHVSLSGQALNKFLPFLNFIVGMLVVSLNTLPYHMLSQFHSDETVRRFGLSLPALLHVENIPLLCFQYRNKDGSKRGIGVDCSLLNSCYFLGELVAAASLGPLLDFAGVNYCMVIGAVFTLLGNVCMFFLFFFKR